MTVDLAIIRGFNLGLLGRSLLADQLRLATPTAADPGESGRLRRYEAAPRCATRPLYLATNAIARPYTDDRMPSVRSTILAQPG